MIATNLNTRDIKSNLALLKLFVILKNHSKLSFLVGGCVRDLLLDKEAKDFDIVTDCDIHELAPILQTNGWLTKHTGEVFKILFVSEPNLSIKFTEQDAKNNGWCLKLFKQNVLTIPELQQFEVANFRSDSKESDGRRPASVSVIEIDDSLCVKQNICQDAERRDFTINAIYLDPFTMAIIDPTGNGIDDICSRILRFNGNPFVRIKEDNLRVSRFYRFLKKGFKGHPESLQACRDLFDVSHSKIAPERVRAELEKMIDKNVLNASKGRFKITDFYVHGHFLLNDNDKIVSFNGKVSDIIKTEPNTLFMLFSFMIKGYVPVPSTLASAREHFNTAYMNVKPNDLRLILESIVEM